MKLVLWLLLAAAVFYVLPMLVLSAILYSILLVRTKPEKWGRECSIPEDAEYLRMFHEGLDWNARWQSCRRDVEIKSGKLRLKGQYFDFGARKAVIIIPGRMESCLYSYYFAEPYRKAGYNVLAIDNRAHGESQGKVSSLGFREYRDIHAWSRLLHDELGNDQVVLHGICIGASTALFAITAPDCPPCIQAMTADGMYETFCESFRNHMILDKRPTFPLMWGVMLLIRVISGANVVTDGPGKRISRMTKPILFLHSREDVFSVPEKAQKLYDACPAWKRLVWFEKGAHSRLRINNPSVYDCAICDFLAEPVLSAREES